MFSVVIPLYNKELSIRNTIQSVLAQTCQKFEIVVVNDGSTDNSAKVVEVIDDARIRLIDQENQGVSSARNRGIQEASYDWVAFLDGDDMWHEEHLQEISTMMRQFPQEKVFVTSFEYSGKKTMFRHQRCQRVFKVENYFKEAREERLIWTSIVVIHKSCFGQVGGFDVGLKYGEDIDLWTRLAREYSIVKSSAITAVYRLEAENRSNIGRDLRFSYIFCYDLSLAEGSDEKEYFERCILRELYGYLRAGKSSDFFLLKSNHSSISYIKILRFVVSHMMSRALVSLNKKSHR